MSVVPRVTTVNPQRIRENLKAFASMGYRAGRGMNRLAFSRTDLRARQVLIHRLSMLGLETSVDPFGTVFGRISSERNQAEPAVMVGSHLDAVPGGGRFDGSIGVVAALEAAAVAREHIGDAHFPLEVVSFSTEESSRFGRGTLGSGLMTGAWEPDDILGLTDAQGRTLADVLQRIGLDPDALGTARRNPEEFLAFFEMHIEQGRVLEELGKSVGVVTTIAAPTRMRLTLEGQADHSGATPMSLRRDALAGAAEVVLAVERLARSVSGVVGTVGALKVEPGAINVVPGKVELSIDIRGTDGADKRRVVDDLRREVDQMAQARDLNASYVVLTDEEPVTLDPRMIRVLEQCADERGIESHIMPSGAGHDAMHMAELCPTGMLFVPSVGGISHHTAEWTEFDDIVTGVQVMVDATLNLMLNGVPEERTG